MLFSIVSLAAAAAASLLRKLERCGGCRAGETVMSWLSRLRDFGKKMKKERYFIFDGLKSVSLLHIRFGFHFFLSFVKLVQQIEFITTVASSR